MRLCRWTHRDNTLCWSSSSSRSLDFEPIDVSYLSPYPEDGRKHHLSRTHVLLIRRLPGFLPSPHLFMHLFIRAWPHGLLTGFGGYHLWYHSDACLVPGLYKASLCGLLCSSGVLPSFSGNTSIFWHKIYKAHFAYSLPQPEDQTFF